MMIVIGIVIGAVCGICGYYIGKKMKTHTQKAGDNSIQIQIGGYQPTGSDNLGDAPSGSTVQSDD